jgi:hypothetical protein
MDISKLSLLVITVLSAAALARARDVPPAVMNVAPAHARRLAGNCNCDGFRRFVNPCCRSNGGGNFNGVGGFNNGGGFMGGGGGFPGGNGGGQQAPQPQAPPAPPRLQGCFAPRQGVRVVVGTSIPCCPNAAAPCPAAANPQTGTSECVGDETWRVVQVRMGRWGCIGRVPAARAHSLFTER